jgi:hypothetical protein
LTATATEFPVEKAAGIITACTTTYYPRCDLLMGQLSLELDNACNLRPCGCNGLVQVIPALTPVLILDSAAPLHPHHAALRQPK